MYFTPDQIADLRVGLAEISAQAIGPARAGSSCTLFRRQAPANMLITASRAAFCTLARCIERTFELLPPDLDVIPRTGANP